MANICPSIHPSETNPLPHQRRCHTLPIPSLHNTFFLSRFPDGRRHGQHRHGINPFCEIAMEEELRLREAGAASEDVATTVSPGQAADTLRTTLAMGANRAVHVLHDPDPARPLLPLTVDKILRALALQETPCLLILGKQVLKSASIQGFVSEDEFLSIPEFSTNPLAQLLSSLYFGHCLPASQSRPSRLLTSINRIFCNPEELATQKWMTVNMRSYGFLICSYV
ncbi:electron transfer flavoprotein subunit beta-like [Triticum dicoccoides]|uniref:electron transfer flavoprotein subunit beta-like n=1 Tax=Triticum dicoccoides TaxID=85692 RepID=UPI001891CE56|nr:electron transfer flavoprotein subunit beta-like [Triticum dicoccoides]